MTAVQRYNRHEVIRFNRHEVFNKGDYDSVRNAIDAISLSKNHEEATNYLYGLYDGFLYPELLTEVRTLTITHPLLQDKYNIKAVITDLTSVVDNILYYLLQDTSVK